MNKYLEMERQKDSINIINKININSIEYNFDKTRTEILNNDILSNLCKSALMSNCYRCSKHPECNLTYIQVLSYIWMKIMQSPNKEALLRKLNNRDYSYYDDGFDGNSKKGWRIVSSQYPQNEYYLEDMIDLLNLID